MLVSIRHRNWSFARSGSVVKAMAMAFKLIEMAKMTVIGPLDWLTDITGHIADHKITLSDELAA